MTGMRRTPLYIDSDACAVRSLSKDSQYPDLPTLQATAIAEEYPSPVCNSDVMSESKYIAKKLLGTEGRCN